ncbi:MAG: peptide-methionine (S)-S-oxide reductase MsrA [Cyclobacteriaceae bacterium]
MERAVFGAGCFWCTEAIFQKLNGVISVDPAYTGGHKDNPTYNEVCMGTTGHAEVIDITFDPDVITFGQLLEVFWKTHDPTTLNRQGNDIGTQYRSAIFYSNESQRSVAVLSKEKLDESGAWEQPIVTDIVKLGAIYPAENYHHNYFNAHKSEAYCAMVIKPKLDKFEKAFKPLLH